MAKFRFLPGGFAPLVPLPGRCPWIPSGPMRPLDPSIFQLIFQFAIPIPDNVLYFVQATTAQKARRCETPVRTSVQAVTTAPQGPVWPRCVTRATTRTLYDSQYANSVPLDSTATTLSDPSPHTLPTFALQVSEIIILIIIIVLVRVHGIYIGLYQQNVFTVQCTLTCTCTSHLHNHTKQK
jgi:hypothetical protein